MSYTLKSVVARSDGYYRFSFTPCSKEFVVDIPKSRLEEVFAALSDLNFLDAFTIEVRKRQEFGNPSGNRNGFELRFQNSEDWIVDVVPVNQNESE